MQIKELINQLKKLDENQDIYMLLEGDLKEPRIQTLDFKDDIYHVLVFDT